jgi:uncharacterized protein YyaL (SSP411 family)
VQFAGGVSKRSAIITATLLVSCAHAGEPAKRQVHTSPWKVLAPKRAAAPLSEDEHNALLERYLTSYDRTNGGFAGSPRAVDPCSTELAMLAAHEGVPASAAMAQKTLLKNAGKRDDGTFAGRAETLRLYALAAGMWGSRAYEKAARAIEGELAEEMKTELATDESGLAITALATLHDVTGDRAVLERAIDAAERMLSERKLIDGGFRQSGGEIDRPRLADTLAMGQAMLALHASTADERWLGEAEDAALFIGRTFTDEDGGFFALARLPEADRNGATKHIEENVRVARFANLLAHYTGRPLHRQIAEHAMRYLSSAEVSSSAGLVAGILIADAELRREPMRVIVVGGKDDQRARALHRAALSRASTYRVVEWVDPGPAPLRYQYVRYPRPDRAAAIACAAGDCTPPVFRPEEVTASLAHLGG